MSCVLSDEVWLFKQDVARFGKGELYESLQKEWIEDWKAFSAEGAQLPSLALKDPDAPQYFYLIPVGSFAGIGVFLQDETAFAQSRSEEAQRRDRLRASVLNFQIYTAHAYLPACSLTPSETACSLWSMPYVRYAIYSVEPGNDDLFEEHLAKTVEAFQDRARGWVWRTWKVIMGADVPKYVVAVFANEEARAEKGLQELNLAEGGMRAVITRERTGSAVARRDLSLVPPQCMPAK
jgi:hypothetical protein